MDRPGSGLRRLAGLLLVLNLGVLVFGLGFMHWPHQSAVVQEFNGDKVTFLSTPTTENSTHAEAALPAEPPPALPAPFEMTGAAPSCLSWKSLDTDKFLAVEAHLKQIGITPGSYELSVATHLGWWVFLPPFRDTESMRGAMEDARQKGVTDMAQVRGGKLANAVSLGAFPTLERAREHVASLTDKGLKGVKLGPRPEAGEVRLKLSAKGANRFAVELAKAWPKGLEPEGCKAE